MMATDIARIRTLVRRRDFVSLFQELGWDKYRQLLDVSVDGKTYHLEGIAHKRGVAVFSQIAPNRAGIPDHATRLAIERRVQQLVHEHIIVFTNAGRTVQLWQWVRRAVGKPVVVREYTAEEHGERVAQLLAKLTFELDEEDALLQPHVVGRVAETFDVEPVTRRFYERFKQEHVRFLSFIAGIDIVTDREWYASLMFNRLMFVYFIQRKGFLDGNTDYLRDRLRLLRGKKTPHGFLSFYRYFLIRLFHEGLGSRIHRNAELEKLLGRVPYLNGGLFEIHQLEKQYPDIDIPDEAFEKIFDFFDEFRWHLDERPSRSDKEINPDVLGYIFEKYINQKEMGAYYTQEDVTSYITTNAILPALIDGLTGPAREIFGPAGRAWELLAAGPERYLPAELLHGTERPLPGSIAKGVTDVMARGSWNAPASDDHGLPTETWREHVARRAHVERVRRAVASGVSSMDDAISLGIDLRQLLIDVIAGVASRSALRAIYQSLTALTVLDPSCGSGAFLFAALGVLQPIHEACLERMAAVLREGGSGPDAEYFQSVLARCAAHRNQEYFVLKTIVLNNLYGVDLMEEATEICKLRLFLKLAAQLEAVDELEPLPDLDFNIRSGNSLVGLSSFDAARWSAQRKGQRRIDLDSDVPTLQRAAEQAGAAFTEFRELQTLRDREASTAYDDKISAAKQVLRRKLQPLREDLDRYVAKDYTAEVATGKAMVNWRAIYQPFHWAVEFYAILRGGGFSVIVGNPPYVELKNVEYEIRGLRTVDCGDLYACFVERSCELLAPGGRLGLIVPISAFGVDGFKSLQAYTIDTVSKLWLSFFANRPTQLFNGAQKRLTIMLGKKRLVGEAGCDVHTTSYIRWKRAERGHLFATRIRYVPAKLPPRVFRTSIEKLGSRVEVSAFEKMLRGQPLAMSEVRHGGVPVYYTRKFGYYLLFLDRPSGVVDIKTGKKKLPSELKEIRFPSQSLARSAIAVLSSTSFFWFWNVLSDCRNLNRRDLLALPVDVADLPERTQRRLADLGARYLRELKQTSRTMTKSGLKLESFDYAKCKPILDEIDRVLGEYFSFTAEELDFILNYDVKYRGESEDLDEASAEDGAVPSVAMRPAHAKASSTLISFDERMKIMTQPRLGPRARTRSSTAKDDMAWRPAQRRPSGSR